jgi:ketosteroid isomerase-like protein
MLSMRQFVAITSATLMLVACAPPNDTSPSAADHAVAEAAAKVAVEKRMNDYLQVVREEKTDALADYWSEDVICFEPEAEIHGRAAFIAGVTEVMKGVKVSEINLQNRDIFVHDEGAFAYQYASVDYTVVPRDGKGAPSRVRFNIVARWAKESDGIWRIDRFVGTPMPPLGTTSKG